MRNKLEPVLLAGALCVMNSSVAYTLQLEIQHVCQGYLGKSHSLVCVGVLLFITCLRASNPIPSPHFSLGLPVTVQGERGKERTLDGDG